MGCLWLCMTLLARASLPPPPGTPQPFALSWVPLPTRCSSTCSHQTCQFCGLPSPAPGSLRCEGDSSHSKGIPWLWGLTPGHSATEVRAATPLRDPRDLPGAEHGPGALSQKDRVAAPREVLLTEEAEVQQGCGVFCLLVTKSRNVSRIEQPQDGHTTLPPPPPPLGCLLSER